MNGHGGARGNTAYSYGFKAIKVPGERGDDGELTTADLGDAEQVEVALYLAKRMAPLGCDAAAGARVMRWLAIGLGEGREA